jgi:hypothetical protein
MTVEQMIKAADQIRQARRNPQPVTRERALKLFEQHRQAMKASRLGLRISPSEARE